MAAHGDTTMDNRRKWHWSKELNPVYLTALGTILAALIGWARYVDNGQVEQNSKILQNTKDIDEIKKNSREDMKNMSDKIDKIYEIVSKEKK